MARRSPPKATLTLIDTKDIDVEALARAFEAMTGRKVTPQEMEECRAILAGEKDDEIDAEDNAGRDS